MKPIFYLLLIILVSSYGNGQSLNTNTPLVTKKERSHTDQQLESFLDSIGNLSPTLFSEKVTSVADSTFKNRVQMNKIISPIDLTTLKQLVQEEEDFKTIDIITAKRIFGKIKVDNDYVSDGKIPIAFYSFDKKESNFDEYAICLGNPYLTRSSLLYFIKKNKIISKHDIYHRYGLELKHFIDNDGKTIIYYKENFGSGTGIWQFNYYFYKFYEDKLIPVLNELENGNLNGWGSKRSYWLKTYVTNTKPLTLKMVYHQELYAPNASTSKIVNDSTFVQYNWNENTFKFIGDYKKSKINKYQTLTYYLSDNELLFINTYYSTLKEGLKDKKNRNIILNYLNDVKIDYQDSYK
ncbi:hypothetical protein [Aquimarina litoralis]|uniref:hypothetical protein n=1 Tax=Aquimarina litoralis TaxID=584605 RepID=UPI001C559F3B|nr:hypothetical protein [Aquimarina litoralis]MBW1294797.1 hypothetical protein [Aquimarina litoralis]